MSPKDDATEDTHWGDEDERLIDESTNYLEAFKKRSESTESMETEEELEQFGAFDAFADDESSDEAENVGQDTYRPSLPPPPPPQPKNPLEKYFADPPTIDADPSDLNSTLLGEGISQISSADGSGFPGTSNPISSLRNAVVSESNSLQTTSMASSIASNHRLRQQKNGDDISTSSGREPRSTEDQKSSVVSDTSRSSQKDPLRWWQKNYGDSAAGETNEVVRHVLAKVTEIKQQELNERHKNRFQVGEDEEDIFSGLEDERELVSQTVSSGSQDDLCLIPEPSSVLKGSQLGRPAARELPAQTGPLKPIQLQESVAPKRSRVTTIEGRSNVESSSGSKFSNPCSVMMGEGSQQLAIAKQPCSATDDKESYYQCPASVEKRKWYKETVETIHETHSAEDSYQGSSVITGPSQILAESERRRQRRESAVDESDDEGEQDEYYEQDDEDLLDESAMVDSIAYNKSMPKDARQPKSKSRSRSNQAETSIFAHLGSALAETVSAVCRLPSEYHRSYKIEVSFLSLIILPCLTERLPMERFEPEECAEDCVQKTTKTCRTPLMAGAAAIQSCRPNAVAEDVTVQEASASFGYQLPYGVGSVASTYLAMDEQERQLWNAWGAQDREHQYLAGNGDDINEQLSDLANSSVHSPEQKMTSERRHEAQIRLLEIADKAVALYGGNAKGTDPSTASNEARNLTPVIAEGLPEIRNLEERQLIKLDKNNISLDQKPSRAVIAFSSLLKQKGVRVLKLGRQNKWQVRYLTVSKEVVWVSPHERAREVGQCPKALLWVKRFDSKAHDLSKIKSQGRGGVLFSDLNKVEYVKGQNTSATESFDRISKTLKRTFPSFFGVSVDYSFHDEDGTRSHRSVMLSFMSKADAEAFITAIKIIKDALARDCDQGGGAVSH